MEIKNAFAEQQAKPPDHANCLYLKTEHIATCGYNKKVMDTRIGKK